MKVSIAIPCYEMKGYGAVNLSFALESIAKQTYKNIEVIISDHSRDNKIEELCIKYSSFLDLKYLKYEDKRGSSSANLNNCILNSSGDIIKILFQDDYLYGRNVIQNIVNEFDQDTYWLVTSFYQTYDRKNLFRHPDPYLTNILLYGNTIGPPSGLSMINKDVLYFDEELLWWMDTDYYKRLYDKYGLPKIITKPTFVNLLWDGQVSNTSAKSQDLREAEAEYLVGRKHAHLPMRLPNGADIYEPANIGYRGRKILRRIYHQFKKK
jgi:glycosyltransferase involved in cell wall biosynthesis